jgi:hypothetical protein
MSIKLMSAVFDDEQLDQAETLTMLALSDWANDDGRCWPSLPQLVKKTRLSERGLRLIIKRLVDQGVLEKQDIAGKGTKYLVKPRHYVPPRHAMPPAPDAATPARGAANTSIPVSKTSRAKALSVRATSIGEADHLDPGAMIDWASKEMRWPREASKTEWQRFVDSAEAHDRRYKDWMAAWRSWCRSDFCKTKPLEEVTKYRQEPMRV